MQAAEDADVLVIARDKPRTRGPHSIGHAARFVVDHVPCTVVLAWPAGGPDGPPPNRSPSPDRTLRRRSRCDARHGRASPARARRSVGGLAGAARPDAVARRREQGRRTARENVADLVDEGSFVEYRPLIVRRAGAAAARRRSCIARTPADGVVGGLGRDRRATRRGRCPTTTRCSRARRACANHLKKDRLFELAGGGGCRSCCSPRAAAGGRATSTGRSSRASTCHAFHLFARLSGLVPLVGIAAGYCFAGNAALLGCCDVVIATEDSEHRHGRAGDDRGRRARRATRPRTIGPIDVQDANGVVDLRVADEAAAVARREALPVVLRSGPHARWTAPDPRTLRAR